MPIGSAVHARTLALCESLNFREWSGYYAVSAYESHHEHEYTAIRNAAALIDVSPLFKYLVTGPDAVVLVDRVITRDARAMAVGRVTTPWCDDRGKVIDDGTVTRGGTDLRWTAADRACAGSRTPATNVRIKTSRTDRRARASGPHRGRAQRGCHAVCARQILPHDARHDRPRSRRDLTEQLPATWATRSGYPGIARSTSGTPDDRRTFFDIRRRHAGAGRRVSGGLL
jgi:hypothetical protein